MSTPPPPPAPPGGEFTSRQATPTGKSKTPPPAGKQPPAVPAGKATTPPARAQSPGKQATPPARGQSPTKGAPPAPAKSVAAKSSTPPVRADTPPRPGQPPAPPAPGAPKKAATPVGGTSPAKSVPGKDSPAKRAPTPDAGGKKAPAPPAPKKQPPPGAADPEEPQPPPKPPAPGGPKAATPSGETAAEPPVPAQAKKSPAGKRSSPARASTPSKKQPSAPAADAVNAIPTPVAGGPQTPARSATNDSVATDAPANNYSRSYSNVGDQSLGSPIGNNNSSSMMYSPPPALMSSQMAAGSSRRMPMPKKNIDASARAAQSVLDHDPRSGLPLIAFPADRQGALSHLGNDILLHFFEDCDRVSSKGKPLRRIVLITDQTLFVCEQTGSLTRCVQISKISQVNVAMDNSNEIALVVPSEYDILLRFDRRSQRDDILTILRAVHKRMVSAELRVWHVKDVRPNQYRMEKPPGFQLQRIPQRSRANLAKALESIDANDRERRTAIQRVQERLDNEQRQEILDKTQETSIVQSKLDEANSRLRTQLDEIDKLRQAYAKIQRRVEEIDSQYTGTSAGQDITIQKDMKIRELHEVVDALTASVTKANEERMRIEKLRRAGDFDEKELDHVDSDIPRLRGRSLHHQGLVEVLQRQLMEKQRELADLQSRQVDLQKLNLDIRKKEEQLRELEQTVVGSTNSFKDPTTMYSSAAQAGFEDLLRTNPGSPTRSIMGGGAASPSGSGIFGSPSTLFDDIARQRSANPSGANDEDAILLSRGSLSAPKQFFATDIPEFRVPPDERDFKEDPRTGLRFKDLEGPFVDKFPSLQGAIIFFFAVGTKENKRGQSQKRVLIVTDQVVMQCTTGGAINRTFEVKDIREFIRDSDQQVALVVEGLNEYDLLMKFKDGNDVCQELQDVIS
ncbi:Hypothetical protein, putative, partial [Bodo saltans]